jgi:hypothetical protein
MMRGSNRRARSLALAVGVALLAAPLVGAPAQAAGTRTLNLTPEEDNSPVGTNRTIKADLSAPVGAGETVNIDFEIVGPSDPDNGNSPASPDRSCTVPEGATRCTVGYVGTVAGEDFDRGWIDEDNNDSTTEADGAEGFDASVDPGAPEPDGTDVVETLWFGGLTASTTMDCTPEASVATVGSAGRFTCSVVRQSTGGAIAGVLVDGENLSGANDPDDVSFDPADYDDLCVTNANGTCSFSISSSPEDDAGQADICFWADEDADDGFHATEEFDGGDCTEAIDAPESDNRTDVASMRWKYPRSITVQGPGQTSYGDAFTLEGSVSGPAQCASAVDVKLTRVFSDGSKSVVGSVRTDSNGHYSLALRADRGASYTAAAVESDLCRAAISADRRVSVHKKVALSVSRKTVARGRKVRVRARIAPCAGKAGQKVVLYRSVDGGASFARIGAEATNDSCVAVFKRRVRRATIFRAWSPKQDADHLGGTSLPKMVRIK